MPEQTIFGFDYGSKRIGIAVGQSLTKSAHALTQINNALEPEWQKLDLLMIEWQPQTLVVGLPLNMDDSIGHSAVSAKKFAQQLQQRYQLPVELVDERLSSREARERLQQQGIKKPEKQAINSMAAQIILESWLQNLESIQD